MKEYIYRQIIEESHLPYVYVKVIGDATGKSQIRILDSNKSFKVRFKVTQEQIEKTDFKDLLLEREYSILMKELSKANKNGRSTFQYECRQDKLLNIEIFCFEENEYHMRMTSIDRYNHKLSKIIKKCPFPMWIKDREGRYIDVNDEYLSAFNLEYEDVVGRLTEEIWEKQQAKAFREIEQQVISQDNTFTQSKYVKISTIKERQFELATWAYRDEVGTTILGVMGFAIEITDKMKLKESIKKNEENFLDIANNIDELIIIRDEEKLLYANSYFEKLYHFKPDALYENIDNWHKHWDKVEYLEEPVTYDYREIDISTFRVVKYGEVDKWIRSKFIPIFDEHGNILRKIGMLKDITDKKRIEEEMENLRMEFFSNVSHELRTPINIIMSALQMMKIRIDEIDEETVRPLGKYVDIITQNGHRLVKLVNNLIDTTKINSGNFKYRPTNQDLVSFVEDICSSVVDFVERSQLEIIFDTDQEEKIIAFDKNQMERIILNLISNSIKFNKPNGKIEVTISTEDQIEISVKDSGVGIPEDKLENVFKRFEQVDKSLKRENEGSGIGLALVKSLIEMHGGTIRLKSKVGEGSEFIIGLPDVLVAHEAEEMDHDRYWNKQSAKVDIEFSDIYY